MRLVADNTLVGVRMDDGMPVAVIGSRSGVNYAIDTIQSGQSVHVQATGMISIESLFDLVDKRLWASNVAIDITYTVTTPLATGAHLLAQTHFIDIAALRPASTIR